jgi:hypothetical protein
VADPPLVRRRPARLSGSLGRRILSVGRSLNVAVTDPVWGPGLEFRDISKTMKGIKMVTGTATSAVLACLRPVFHSDSGDSISGSFASPLTCSPVDAGERTYPCGRGSPQPARSAGSLVDRPRGRRHPRQSVGQDVRSCVESASMELPMSVMVSPTAAICAPVDSMSSSSSTVTRMSWSETIRSLTSGW